MKKSSLLKFLILPLLLSFTGCDYFNFNPNWTITFESNGGTYIAPITAKKGIDIPKPEDPTKEDYIFVGWYSSNDYSYRGFINWPIEHPFDMGAADITVYARWTTYNSPLEFEYLTIDDEIIITNYVGESLVVCLPPTIEGLPVTRIGEHAFAWKPNISITNVILPDTIVEIGGGAFSSCKHLVSVNIPDSVLVIEHGVFFDCKVLRRIYLGKGVVRIGRYAFLGTILYKIILPLSLLILEEDVFYQTEMRWVFSEAMSKPEGWELPENTVYWADQWHYDSFSNEPTPNDLSF